MNSIPKENYQSPLSSVPATLPTALPSYQTSYSVTHPRYHQIAQDELNSRASYFHLSSAGIAHWAQV